MITDLPVGSIIKIRYRGEWEFWQLVAWRENDHAMRAVDRHLKAGDVIHQCVSKDRGNTLVVKRTYTLKKDCQYIPLTKQQPDSTPEDVDAMRSDKGLAAFSVLGMNPVLVVVAKGGHPVLLWEGQPAAVAGGGMSYTSQKTTPDIMQVNAADVIAFAESVVDEFHAEMPAPLKCVVCSPPMRNIEVR
jgi:hypothetical protein